MYFIFDLETIPDIDFIRTVLDNRESDEENLLEKASELLARNKSGFLPPCTMSSFLGWALDWEHW